MITSLFRSEPKKVKRELLPERTALLCHKDTLPLPVALSMLVAEYETSLAAKLAVSLPATVALTARKSRVAASQGQIYWMRQLTSDPFTAHVQNEFYRFDSVQRVPLQLKEADSSQEHIAVGPGGVVYMLDLRGANIIVVAEDKTRVFASVSADVSRFRGLVVDQKSGCVYAQIRRSDGRDQIVVYRTDGSWQHRSLLLGDHKATGVMALHPSLPALYMVTQDNILAVCSNTGKINHEQTIENRGYDIDEQEDPNQPHSIAIDERGLLYCSMPLYSRHNRIRTFSLSNQQWIADYPLAKPTTSICFDSQTRRVYFSDVDGVHTLE